ncbi:hypothetical protein JCM10213_001510 [Rhodosporidiobolus nylandii]
MTASSLKATLSAAIDTLLSLRSSAAQQTAALADLEGLVASLAIDPSPLLLDAFLTAQDSLGRNLTAALLEWLGRALVRDEVGGGQGSEDTWENLARALRLLQGLLLLHRPSQKLFARRSSLEYLLAVLNFTRPTAPFSPALSSPKPFPSPVIFPSSPSLASPNLNSASSPPGQSTAAPQLALAALDTLLCALVDRPKNMRVFEELGGLDTLVKILKDKSLAQVVRIKVIELLYFYLLPEQAVSTISGSSTSSYSTATSSAISTLDSRILASDLPNLLAGVADFVPQTPQKARPHSHASATPSNAIASSSRPLGGTGSASSRESSPTRTPRRNGHSRSQSLVTVSTPLSSSSSTSRLVVSPSTASRPPLSASRPSRSMPPASTPLGSSSRIRASRPEPPISESSDGGETSADERTPRASRRLSGLLSSAAAALPSRSARPGAAAASDESKGHRRTRSTSSVERDSSRERVGLNRSGLPAQPPAPRTTVRTSRGSSDAEGGPAAVPTSRKARAAKGSSHADAMPPPPLPSSSSRSRTGHSRSRSLASYAPLQPTPAPLARSAPAPPPPRERERERAGPARHVRTEQEKKDLLRRVMPNVDALEERFKAMGLGMS